MFPSTPAPVTTALPLQVVLLLGCRKACTCLPGLDAELEFNAYSDVYGGGNSFLAVWAADAGSDD